jgi:hypothetical protein
MKITMLKTVLGSDDGVSSILFQSGKDYEVGEKLCKSFLDSGFAKVFKEDAVIPAENKMETYPPNTQEFSTMDCRPKRRKGY